MRFIRFEYKGSTRRALEIKPQSNGCMLCFQFVKNGSVKVGYRSFKVSHMRDVRGRIRVPKWIGKIIIWLLKP